MKLHRLLLAILLLAGCRFACVGQELSQNTLKAVKDATFFLKVVDAEGQKSQGTAFLIKKNLLVTNAHVLGMAEYSSRAPKSVSAVMFSGDTDNEWAMDAELVGCDKVNDLAFLRIEVEEDIKPLQFAERKQLRETTPIYTVGFPFGDALARTANPSATIGKGSVSSLRKGPKGELETIQIDADLNPGNSGGPIILKDGKVVAVAVATITGTQISFCIPAEIVSRLLTQGGISQVTFSDIGKYVIVYQCKIEMQSIDPMKLHKELLLKYWVAANENGVKTGERTIPMKLDKNGKWFVNLYGLPVTPRRKLYYEVHAKMSNDKTVILREARPASNAVWGMREVKEQKMATLDKERIKFPPKLFKAAPIIKPHIPDNLPQIEAKLERDEKGRQFVAATSSPKKITLSGRVLFMGAPPSGREVYAVYEGQTGIHVLNPLTLEKVATIPTPRFPTHFYCEENIIVVACNKSKVITEIDSVKRRPIKAYKLKEHPQSEPVAVYGRDADGAFLTCWKEQPRGDGVLFAMTEKKSQKLEAGQFEWVCYLPDANFLFVQDAFDNSPSGAGDLYSMTPGGGKVNLFHNKLFGSSGFHNDFPPVFLTNDRTLAVMSTQKLTGRNRSYWPYTYLVEGALKEIKASFPGVALTEVPSNKYFVTYGPHMYDSADQRDSQKKSPTIFYATSDTGRIIRKVRLEGLDPHPVSYLKVRLIRSRLFVPGSETFLYFEPTYSKANTKIRLYRCGPVDPEIHGIVSASGAVKNNPPTTLTPGKKTSFLPNAIIPDGKTAVFKLKEQFEGMTINSDSGQWEWTPSDAWLGEYKITILVEVDGKVIEEISWTALVE